MRKGTKQVSTKVIVDKEDEKENSTPNVTPTPNPTPNPSPYESSVFGRKSLPKQEYQLNDTVIVEKEYGVFRARFISNEKGTFFDFRRYFYGRPSQKGVRVTKETTKQLLEWLKDALERVDDYEQKI